MMAAFRTVVFDMDGTLVDTMKMTALAFRDLAGKHGLEQLPAERIRSAIGLSDAFFYQTLYPDADEEKLRAFGRVVEVRENEYAHALGPELLFPGVFEMLVALKATERTLFIASTGSDSHVTTALSEGGVIGLFDRIACGKSDKTGMLMKLIHGINPEECAIVGDTGLDAFAGRCAGIVTLGAGFGYLKKEDYALFDRVFATPAALTAALAGVVTDLREEEG